MRQGVRHAMKRASIIAFSFCLILMTGCSAVDSSRYLYLVDADGEFHEFRGHDWVTNSREYSFGKYRPPLYEFSLEGKGKLIVYPVFIGQRSFTGPPLLPFFPVSESLYTPTEKYILQFVYYGDSEDFSIEMVNDWSVDQQLVKKTDGFAGKMFSLTLNEDLIVDGEIVIKLLCQGEHLTLKFQSERFTNFIPFLVSL